MTTKEVIRTVIKGERIKRMFSGELEKQKKRRERLRKQKKQYE